MAKFYVTYKFIFKYLRNLRGHKSFRLYSLNYDKMKEMLKKWSLLGRKMDP